MTRKVLVKAIFIHPDMHKAKFSSQTSAKTIDYNSIPDTKAVIKAQLISTNFHIMKIFL